MLLRGSEGTSLTGLNKDPEFKRRILALKGKRLGCFCQPEACHGDVIADWLNKMEEKEVE
jgi:Domain of unknown function (DUF4326)